jgi:F-type H+-transporting ATPase subunit gamma
MTIEALKKRIKTTEDLREIVSTMKSLSSVSILQYEQANNALEKYRQNLHDAFHAYVKKEGIPSMPNSEGLNKYLIILIGSDSGMVGKFNKEIILSVKAELKKQNIHWKDVLFMTIGKRITMLAEQAKFKIYAKYPIANSAKMVNSIAETVIMRLDEATQKEGINRVAVWYHKKMKSTSVSLHKEELIPFDTSSLIELKNKPWETNNVPLLPLDKSQMFSALLSEHLSIAVASQLNYSLAAEHYTRMTNMQNAEKNIDESLEAMNLEYQQKRQENITDELIDVISGAEAMK